MRRVHSHVIHRAAAALVGAVVLIACAGNVNSGALGGGTAVQAPAAQVGQAAVHNDAGQYSGTTTDTIFGSGSASASLAQDKHVVGGSLTASLGSVSISNSVAVHTSTGTELAGAEVANVNGNVCTFSLSATYDLTAHTLNGTYQAVHGCAGESGSYSLTEDCSYSRGGLLDAVPSWKGNGAKPNHGVHPC